MAHQKQQKINKNKKPSCC